MPKAELYTGREATLVKHVILERYLSRFAYKVGSWRDTLTFVDCFSGPWSEHAPNLSDTSFSIAIEELRKARQVFANRGKQVRLRCFFCEEDRDAFLKLERFRSQIDDVEIRTSNTTFEAARPAIKKFCQLGGSGNFTFFFVDPLSVVRIGALKPLVQSGRCEVLVNLIATFARRFCTGSRFEEVCGQNVPAEYPRFPSDTPRALQYADALQRECGFRYVSTSTILHPRKYMQFFHLVYGTQHFKGVEVFKEAESYGMREMETARIHVRKQLEPEDQQQHFDFMNRAEPEQDRFFQESRREHVTAARNEIQGYLMSQASTSPRDAWRFAMKFPFVTSDLLHKWLLEAKEQGLLEGPIPPAGHKMDFQANVRLARGQ